MPSTTVETGSPIEPLKVFYSYARKDARWLQQLRDNLAPMRDEGLIEDWYDDVLEPGSDFNEEIKDKIEKSDVILLLVDAEFLASNYIKEHELPAVLEREKNGRLLVIPILLSVFANWRQHHLFANRQGLPSGDDGILQYADKRKAWTIVAEGINRAVASWRKKTASPSRELDDLVKPEKGRIQFVYKPPFDAALFQRMAKNPYDVFRPDQAGEPAGVRAFLWLPPRETLVGMKLRPFTTMAVVCDAGHPHSEEQTKNIASCLNEVPNLVRNWCPPTDLTPEQRKKFAAFAATVLASSTFIVAAAVPSLLLGGDPVKNADLVYQILLGMMVLPLASGHADLHFQRFDLHFNSIDKTGSSNRSITAHAKKLLKAKFGERQYGVTQLTSASPDYFYLYAARFVEWAAKRYFNDGKSDWLDLLQTEYFV